MWNPFRKVLGAKRKHDDSNCSGSDEEPRARRRKDGPKTPSPRRSKDATSPKKKKINPNTTSPRTPANPQNETPSSSFVAGDDSGIPIDNSGLHDNGLDEADDDGADADVAVDPFVDYDAEEQEPEVGDIFPTIERDDNDVGPSFEEADDRAGAENSDYEPHSQESYGDGGEEGNAQSTPKERKKPWIPKKRRTEDSAYKPDPQEPSDDDDDDEEDVPKSAPKEPRTPRKPRTPRVAATSRPMITKEQFDHDKGTEGDTMDVIPESDEEPESDWEMEGDEMDAYKDGTSEIPSYNAWCREDKKLHKTLFLRGLHPLMPTTWHFDFLGYPVSRDLFAPLDSTKKVVIHNKSANGQFRTTKALCRIFDLQGRVTALRQTNANDKISPLIEKELNRYINSVITECGLDKYDFAPTIRVHRIDHSKVTKSSIAKIVEDYFCGWAEKHRAWYAKRKIKGPRLLYGIVVVLHAVMLLTIDSERPDAKPRPFADFSMSVEQKWLDSALNIAIPIFLARERLLKLAPTFPLAATPESDHDDD